MKKILALLISLMLIMTTAYAQESKAVFYDSFNIFRFINSSLIRPDNTSQNPPETETPAGDDKDEAVSDDTKKEVLTLRDVVSAMCIADSVSQAVVNGNDVVKVEFYTGNDKKIRECYFSDRSYTKSRGFGYDDIVKGSLFYIRTDSDGMVTNYAVIAVIDKTTKLYNVDEAAIKSNFSSGKISFSYSYITDMRSRNGVTSVSLANGDDLLVAEDAAEFTFDTAGRTPKVNPGSFTKAGVDLPEYDEESNTSKAYTVFAMNYEDETVAICSVSTPVYVKGNIEN